MELKNVSYSHEGMEIIRDVSLAISEGETLLITGPNASGKSTLAKLMAGLLQPTSGEITSGTKKIAYIPANSGLISNRTAMENLNIQLRYHPELKSQLANEEKINQIIRMFGLVEHLNKLPSQLTNGTKRKLAIAKALIIDPELLIIDGLLQDLDQMEGLKLLNKIREMKRQGTRTFILFSSTIEPEINIADRVAVIENGCISGIKPADQAAEISWIKEIYGLSNQLR